MFLKRRQIAIILSVIYLGALTILAAWASHSVQRYSLPIPNALSALTLALPPLAGITIETSNALATALSTSPKHRKADVSTIPPILLPSTITLALLLIYETVMATLAGTHIAPEGSLVCGLREKWQALYHDKNGAAIRTIQDAFQCCGLTNSKDMSWPFPDKAHQGSTGQCVERFGRERDKGCLYIWREAQRRVAGVMLAVAIGVFIWMIVVVATPVAQPKPLRGILRLPGALDDDEEETAGIAGQRSLGYGRYRDVEDDGDDEDDDTSVRREINKLNSQSSLAGLIEGNRSRPSVLVNDSNRWRDDD